VCVGLAHNGRGALKDAEGELCRKIIDQSPTGNLQGLYVVNTAGELVGHIYEFEPKPIRRMLDKALQDFKPVDAPAVDLARRDPKFDLPEGIVVVDVFTKVLGGYGPPKSKEGSLRAEFEKAWQNGLGRDHLWIRKDEAEALTRDVLPESLKKRIARFHLVDDSRGTPLWWKEAEMKSVEMTLRQGRLTGSVRFETAGGDRGYQAELLGFVAARGGKLTRFDVVAKGDFWGKAIYSDLSTPEGGGPKGKYPLANAFSLADDQDGLYRLQPDVLRGTSEYLR
jgi:hypothetical protein